jgi:rRNA pseudouridine-1189 N-methylase Emg1 (Nep1/Mra1 family)
LLCVLLLLSSSLFSFPGLHAYMHTSWSSLCIYLHMNRIIKKSTAQLSPRNIMEDSRYLVLARRKKKARRNYHNSQYCTRADRPALYHADDDGY